MNGQDMESWVLVYDDKMVEWDGIPPPLEAKLSKLKARKINVHDVSIGSDGGWIVSYHSGQLGARPSFNSSYEESSIDMEDLWDLLEKDGEGLNDTKHYVQDIAFTQEMDWVVIYDDYHAVWKSAPEDLQKTIKELYNKKEKIRDLAYSHEDAWVLVSDANKVYTSQSPALPDDLLGGLGDLQEKNHQIHHIEFHINDGWVVIYDKNHAIWKGIPESLQQRLIALSKSPHTIQEVTLWGLPEMPIDGNPPPQD